MTSYYNEIDKHAAAWLRELVKAGHIADGIVDERDIQDVLPSDLAGFTQCHFFAGIGVWSYALRKAGWPDDRPVWTGSCPCQPFSSAGKGSAFADERHLWPAFHHLIKECRPPVVFGEQVAGSAINPWVDLVHADLEAVGYAFGCVPFPSASVGAPHIRDRLYWVADSTSDRWRRQGAGWAAEEGRQPRSERTGQLSDGLEGRGASVGVADSSGERLDQRQRVAGIPGRKTGADARQTAVGNGVCSVVGMAENSIGGRREERADTRGSAIGGLSQGISTGPMHGGADCRPGPTNGFWRDADWILCRDGRWRPVEPKFIWMVNGASCRMERVRDKGAPIHESEEREIDASKNQGSSGEVMSSLPEGHDQKEVQRSSGGLLGVLQEEVLQQGVHGPCNGGRYQGANGAQREKAGNKDGKAIVRDMREGEKRDTDVRPPQGPKSDQQRSIEFANFVRLLPRSYALAKLHGDSRTEEELLALLKASGAERLVQHPSYKDEEIWRSFTKEVQDRVRMGFEKGRWVSSFESPLVARTPPGVVRGGSDGLPIDANKTGEARVMRLRGYGNSINAVQAQAFIEAFMGYQRDAS